MEPKWANRKMETWEQKYRDKIKEQNERFHEEMEKLVQLRVELEMRRRAETENKKYDWLKPEYVKIRTITQAVLNALEHNPLNGVKLSEFEVYLKSQDLPFHRPTVSATLGRLKRDERIIRTTGGRWKLNTPVNKPQEDKQA